MECLSFIFALLLCSRTAYILMVLLYWTIRENMGLDKDELNSGSSSQSPSYCTALNKGKGIL